MNELIFEEKMPEIININFVCPIDGNIMKLIKISKSDRNSDSEYIKGCSNPKCSYSEYYNKKISR